ncbi:MAG: PAS domain S-box protein, partial [Candidatus Dadabacteria bacterium]
LQALGAVADEIAIGIEQKRGEDRLKESEARYRSLVDNALVGVYQSTLDGRFTYVNDAMARMFETSVEEMLVEPVLQRYQGPSDRESFIRILKEKGRVDNYEMTVPTKTGRQITLLVSASLHDETISGMLMDITALKEAEAEREHLTEQLRQAQKMEAVGQLAGGIAHDFNNILNAIIGFGSILKDGIDPDDPLHVNIDEVLMAAERATQLSHSLLAFSRKQVMDLRPVDLCEIVQRITRLLHRVIGEDVELRVSCADRTVPVLADSGQVEQVLMNLATNARDAMPQGGILNMKVGRFVMDDAFTMTHGYGTPGQYAVISVSDTGSGMDAETRQRIFEPFFTTKGPGKGTGLGLAMVYGIVKQHEGFINVYSEPGHGTTFRVYLPAARALAEVEEKKAPPDYPSGGTETILVAEDDPALRKLTSTVLQGAGYTVILAEDGEDAVSKF